MQPPDPPLGSRPSNTALPGPVCASRACCKCCGAPAPLYGVVDFNKSCEDARRQVFELSGMPIYYYRCPRCELLFTTACDRFSPEDFRTLIYNHDYALVDPDYREARPRGNAAMLARLFPTVKPRRLLDYGGGNGLLAERLGPHGFPDARCYDPFVPAFAARPAGSFDCITSFEVVEHSTDPLCAFADMSSFLAEEGLILFSTVLQPPDLGGQRMNWWYVAPRNGHVSLFARKSLQVVSRGLGLQFGSFNDNLHALFRSAPAFARHLLPSPPP